MTSLDLNEEEIALKGKIKDYILQPHKAEVAALRNAIKPVIDKYGWFNEYNNNRNSYKSINDYIDVILTEISWRGRDRKIRYDITQDGHFCRLHEVAYPGNIYIKNDYYPSPIYTSPIIDNPTWLELTILANDCIHVLKNGDHIYLENVVLRLSNLHFLFNGIIIGYFQLGS